jgi:hypothetical protein
MITFITERQTAIQSNAKQNTKAAFVGCDWNSILQYRTIFDDTEQDRSMLFQPEPIKLQAYSPSHIIAIFNEA